jgi:hypothetical protein
MPELLDKMELEILQVQTWTPGAAAVTSLGGTTGVGSIPGTTGVGGIPGTTGVGDIPAATGGPTVVGDSPKEPPSHTGNILKKFISN